MKNFPACCGIAAIVAFAGTVPLTMLSIASGFLWYPPHIACFAAGITVFKACLLLWGFLLCCKITAKQNTAATHSDMAKNNPVQK